MKQIYLLPALGFLLCGTAHAAVEVENPDNKANSDTVTLEELLSTEQHSKEEIPKIRFEQLVEAGKTLGFQGGWISRSAELKELIESRKSKLDALFLFSPLINNKGALPPVIVEAQDVTSFSDDQVRTATRVYKIEKGERFVSVPPTWRDYLYVGLAVHGRPDTPAKDILPKSELEDKLWKQAIKDGWQYGREQADRILNSNMNRLVRDFVGMLRYSTLLQQGMITKMEVAESSQTVTGDTKELTLGDTHRRLIKKAEFEIDPKEWKPAISRSEKVTE